ncbi:hypothetical protein PHYBOEH_005698 [Phytophthora boehmeriae]|uniref:Uncharacterized protein n=1 Tax=Phytophthora boehmeriae TaxID=109152 RepID=A0A8T1X7Z9_9STRA|nr:hypothetical protein PHYBOEH_005698 [Phytophthora boehmeriae]
MGGEGAEAILQRVEKTTDVLALQNVLPDNIEALSQTLEDLQSLVATFRVRRVLELSGPQLMQAGVDLYNAPRAALKALIEAEKTKKQEDEQIKAYPRYLLALTRFVAANIMDLSLLCSKDSGQDADMKRNSLYLDECIDVLRSFGRVGMLMLESASADCGRCEEYLTLAKEAFSSSLQLWSGIGLAYLTKFKQGFELEEVVDDLWDFCTDRVRVLQLLMESSSNALEKFQDIVASLHELQMLAPYKNSYGKNLLDLMASLSEEFCRLNQHELQSPLVEQAMRVCDSLETNGDESLTRLVDAFKQRVLTNLLQSLCATADIDRAEACYQLIPANREPKLLLLMINLYVGTNNFEKAQQLLLLLFQQDNLEDSIAGARSYAQGLAFSEEGLEIYRHLLYNYGDSSFEINLDIACNLALDESKRYQAMDEIKHLEEVILESERYERLYVRPSAELLTQKCEEMVKLLTISTSNAFVKPFLMRFNTLLMLTSTRIA